MYIFDNENSGDLIITVYDDGYKITKECDLR